MIGLHGGFPYVFMVFGVPTSLEHFPTLRPVPCYQNRIRPGFSPLEWHYQSFKRRGLLISRDYPQRSATKVCGDLPHSNGLFPLSVGFCAVDVGTSICIPGTGAIVAPDVPRQVPLQLPLYRGAAQVEMIRRRASSASCRIIDRGYILEM